VKRYSAEPRRLMGLEPVPVAEGKPAEFILFDPEGSTTFSVEFMKSKSRNTPFLDQTLKGSIDLVVFDGQVLLER
jgi:dihydroorotase